MNTVQQKLRVFMKEQGFLVRARTYNRRTSDGLTQVINFQMGRFDPPGTVHIPWFRENYYGKFTVNVGTYIPEVHIVRWGKEGKFVAEYDCSIDERLGTLGPEGADVWWDIPHSIEAIDNLADELRGRFENHAFPFLARFECRDRVLKELLGGTWKPLELTPQARTVCAIIFAARGQLKEARDLLVAQKEEDLRRPPPLGHLRAKHTEELAAKLGIRSLEIT